MNILCCLTVLEEIGLNIQNVNSFFKSQKPLKGRGK